MDQTQHMGKGCSGKPTYRSDASAPLKTTEQEEAQRGGGGEDFSNKEKNLCKGLIQEWIQWLRGKKNKKSGVLSSLRKLQGFLELYARRGDEDQIHISDYKLQLHPVLLLHCIQSLGCFAKFYLQNSPLFRTFPCFLKRHLSLSFCKDDSLLVPSVRRGQWNKIFQKQQFRLVERSGAEIDVHWLSFTPKAYLA